MNHEPEFAVDFFADRPPESIKAQRDWNLAEFYLQELRDLKDGWDGDAGEAVRPELIPSAMDLLKILHESGHDAPHDLYPFLNGTIMLEWQYPNGIIERIEIEEVGHGLQMISYPEIDKGAEFERFTWSRQSSPMVIAHPDPECGDWYERGMFQLAA